MTNNRAGWPMSAEDAARVRAAPALRVLDAGTDNINRVVATREFGLVIDRRRKPRRSAAATGPPPALPTPHFEHDVLRNLNAAGASFVQDIHYADAKGLILEYVNGEPITDSRWYSDAGLRGAYARQLAETMGELARLAPTVTPGVIHRDERGFRPKRVEGTRHFGRLLRDRTILTWGRVMRGWAAGLLREFGDTEHVGARLAAFDPTGDRPVSFLHNDLHPWNTLTSPFTVVDWTNAGAGDALWEATMVRSAFLTDAERDRFMANLRAELPPAMRRGASRDWAHYQVMFRERSRTMSAVFIAEQAEQALRAAARAKTSEARREALRPFAEEIQLLSGSFSGRPLDRTVEETTDLVSTHVERQLGLRGPTRTTGRGRTAVRDNPIAVIHHQRAGNAPPRKPALSPHRKPALGNPAAGAPAPNLSVVGSGLGPVTDKLPAPLPSPAVGAPGSALNTGAGRLPSRTQALRLSARLMLTRTREPGHN